MSYKCQNLECNNEVLYGVVYCSEKCRREFSRAYRKVNEVIKAKTLEEFYRKFFVLYKIFKNRELLDIFKISHNSLRKIYVNVFNYTTKEQISEYWVEYKDRRKIKPDKEL